ncbi:MAG: molecular chaperone DnaK, partial [Acidimicrobiia bacterium]
IKDQGDKLDEEEKSNVESLIAESKTALAGTDIDAIKDATEKLAAASQSMGAKLYEQAAAAAQNEGGSDDDSAGSDDDVVDAEIIEEDDSEEA